ncbi:hypothetical protein DFJ73DRAFT_959673 [Zopfochytrium polystomum]|nr:hypothetical protein DFJ73DRAFT_959673 [Zopfochytrium polystomum]
MMTSWIRQACFSPASSSSSSSSPRSATVFPAISPTSQSSSSSLSLAPPPPPQAWQPTQTTTTTTTTTTSITTSSSPAAAAPVTPPLPLAYSLLPVLPPPLAPSSPSSAQTAGPGTAKAGGAMGVAAATVAAAAEAAGAPAGAVVTAATFSVSSAVATSGKPTSVMPPSDSAANPASTSMSLVDSTLELPPPPATPAAESASAPPFFDSETSVPSGIGHAAALSSMLLSPRGPSRTPAVLPAGPASVAPGGVGTVADGPSHGDSSSFHDVITKGRSLAASALSLAAAAVPHSSKPPTRSGQAVPDSASSSSSSNGAALHPSVPHGAAVPRGPALASGRIAGRPAAPQSSAPRRRNFGLSLSGTPTVSPSSAPRPTHERSDGPGPSNRGLIEITADYLADLLLKSGVGGGATSTATSGDTTPRNQAASATNESELSSSSKASTVASADTTRRNSISDDDLFERGDNGPLSKGVEQAEARETAAIDSGSETGSGKPGPSVLLLDVRSYVNYAHARVSSAVNLCVPSTLLKRAAFGVDKLMETLGSDQARSLIRNYTGGPGGNGRLAVSEPGTRQVSPEREPVVDPLSANPPIPTPASQSQGPAAIGPSPLSKFDHIVLYDADSERLPDNSPIALLGAKFARETRLVGESTTMGWLKGGFKGFMERYGDLVERPNATVTVATATSAAAPMGTARILESSTGPSIRYTQPSDALNSVEHFQILANSPKTTSPPTINAPVASPMAPIMPPGTPPFLKGVLEAGDPKADFVAKWQLVERDEAIRLEMARYARGKDDAFCVSIGLEEGTKNRYSNIWPFNSNRIKLLPLPEPDSSSDYINASLITPPTACAHFTSLLPQTAQSRSLVATHSRRRFIATQNPLPSTIAAFWRMVWDQDVRLILMLCEVSHKSHIYWPTSTAPYQPSPHHTLTLLSSRRVRSHIHLRSFRLFHVPTKTSRTVAHVQFTAWPDAGIPASIDTLFALHHLVESVNSVVSDTSNRPILVHCSAGCGRTGAYIALDTLLAVMVPPNTPTYTEPQPPSIPRATTPSILAPIPSCAVCSPLSSSTPTSTRSSLRRSLSSSSLASIDPTPTLTLHAALRGSDPLLAAVHHLRSQRISMVQTLPQLLMLYEVAVMAFAGGVDVSGVVKPRRAAAAAGEVREARNVVETGLWEADGSLARAPSSSSLSSSATGSKQQTSFVPRGAAPVDSLVASTEWMDLMPLEPETPGAATASVGGASATGGDGLWVMG